MPEEIKERIINLLKEFPDEKYNVKQINSMLGEREVSYPTVLKWVAVLQAEKRIRVDDYGNVKIIGLNKEYIEDDGN